MLKKLLGKIAKWIIYPESPQTKQRKKLLREFEEKLPEIIRYYEERKDIAEEDKIYVRDIIGKYREAYKQDELAYRSSVTPSMQIDPSRHIDLEGMILQLELIVGGRD